MGYPTRWVVNADVPMALLVPRWTTGSGRFVRHVASHFRSVRLATAPTDLHRSVAGEWELAGIAVIGQGVTTAPEAGCSGLRSEVSFERELVSIGVRRQAWRSVVAEHAGISIVMSTKRPAALAGALNLIEQQSVRPRSVMLGLHGADWFGWDPAVLSEFTGLDIEVRSFDEDQTLGSVLDDLSKAAPPGLLTKWDDDDWYGCDHLLDLVAAARFSNAMLIGKGADFVYLESSDVTLRRPSRRSERFGTLLAGGTLAIDRDDLAAVGGWPDIPRHVDKGLIERVRAFGGTTYRTHGFGYVLHRAGPTGDHTWSADDQYFLDGARETWPGRRHDIAGPVGAVQKGQN